MTSARRGGKIIVGENLLLRRGANEEPKRKISRFLGNLKVSLLGFQRLEPLRCCILQQEEDKDTRTRLLFVSKKTWVALLEVRC